jgi:hypothetical protein
MELYGYFTWNHHGWAKIMTVLAPDGSDAAFDHIEAGSDFIVKGGDGRLPQYQEKRGQALAELIERYGIEILDKETWDQKKAEIS